MQKKSFIFASIATFATLLATAAPNNPNNSPAEATPVAASANDSAATLRQQRIDNLKKILPAKLARKPKKDRDAVVSDWQKTWKNEGKVPFDQPQSAMTFFLAKRLPEGQTALAPSDYADALEQAASMPVYSTTRGSFVQAAVPAPGAAANGVITPSLSPGLSTGWVAMGPGNIGGRTRALLIHPTTPNTMWAAGVAGGIWKSIDGGTTWTPKADLLVNIAVNSMILDPRNPDIIYAGTGEGYFNGDAVRGAGILKSTDGGETWSQLASTATPDFFYVQKIVMSSGSSQRIYAATRSGVFRSTNGGASWSLVLNGATHFGGCMDLAIQTNRAVAFVFASCGTFAQAGFANGAIYRALDTGAAQTWTPVFSPANMGRTSLALAPSNQNIIYALTASTAAGNFAEGLLGVFRSTASGAAGSWTTQVSNTDVQPLNRLLLSNPVIALLTECGFGSGFFLNQGWYDNALAVDPVNPDIVWAGGIDTFRSNDGGRNWGQASHWWFDRGINPEYSHADHHGFVFHPGYNGTTNKRMFNINDGGIFITEDARGPVSFSPAPITGASPVCGNTAAGLLAWGEKNNGYQVTQFYHGAHYPSGNTFLGGTQDNGTLLGVTGAPNNWVEVRGGDGGYVAVNPANTNMFWVENTGLSIQRTTNGGASYQSVTSGIGEGAGNFLFITSFAQDPSDANRMWIGGAFPWRTTNATAVPAPAPYWTQAGPFFGARIGAWAVAPSSSDRVYAGTGTGGGVAGNCRVHTTGSGTTATAATVWSSSKVRPDSCFVSWLAVHPTNPLIVYATVSTFNTATGVGHIFKSTNGGATWTNIDGAGATGIPDVPVHTLVMDPQNPQVLYAGTDIGVFISLDDGANWARENTGFANVIVETLTIKNTNPRYIYAFTHGRSLFRAALP